MVDLQIDTTMLHMVDLQTGTAITHGQCATNLVHHQMKVISQLTQILKTFYLTIIYLFTIYGTDIHNRSIENTE